MPWEVAVQLAATEQPLSRQIAIAIATDIERGRLTAGTRQGDEALEHAIAQLLEDGEVQRHVRRALRMYRRRRDALCDELSRRLPQLDFQVPSGGMAVWASAAGIDTDAWVRRGAIAGVAFQAGSMFRFDRAPDRHLRLGFAACNEAELATAVDRMARTLA
jgi:GntR family transcriptional regulator/MocR family aminotransferase